MDPAGWGASPLNEAPTRPGVRAAPVPTVRREQAVVRSFHGADGLSLR